ncbi:RES family NAD+ phosphorylase [Massilia eburnea]|uniref:RES family NAD+ phosphorylase n=1 Tax=Massilia eburnea TaxID=1776165 RepID=UPI003D6BDE0D
MAYAPDNLQVPKVTALKLPPIELLHTILSADLLIIPPGTPIYRAAWVPDAVWPAAVTRGYRFGPPDEVTSAGAFPFFWVYAAPLPFTATWEAQLCKNPATMPGKFIISPGADRALIATLVFDQPLHLLDLTGHAASKLGVYDMLRSPDYGLSQWLGVQLDQVISGHQGAVHGIAYPSRKHPGHNAFAISSRVQASLAGGLIRSVQSFGESELFTKLVLDPCCVDRQWV